MPYLGKNQIIHIKILSLILTVSTLGFQSNENVWEKRSVGILESRCSFVAIDPINENFVYVGTRNTLYQSSNGGQEFITLLQLQGANQDINYIYISNQNIGHIYVATNDGLYVSFERGKSWQKIYEASDPQSRICQSVLDDNDNIYLGTQNGLFITKASKKLWQKVNGELINRAIYKVVNNGQNILIVSTSSLYRLNKENRQITKILELTEQIQEIAEEVSSDDEPKLYTPRIKDLVVYDNKIFLATDQGLFFSMDNGSSWKKYGLDGIRYEDLTSLVILENDAVGKEPAASSVKNSSEEVLFISTKEGVFRNRTNYWEQLYQGMETNHVNYLALVRTGRLLAATDKGLFSLELGKMIFYENDSADLTKNPSQISYLEMENRFNQEPSIDDVHRLAISYAEVHPDKIRQWRLQASKKAWMPNISIGLDGDRNRTLTDSVWGSYTGGGQIFIGPDDKTAYDNLGWGVAMSWDLGELIWNNDQTSIDSRSKLMVELRQDILDQVTRLYFERRRLQIEVIGIPEAQGTLKFERQMRIDELTALIDAYTGGEFSRRVQSRK
jgi:ligand-binding sensor domain-containing protein